MGEVVLGVDFKAKTKPKPVRLLDLASEIMAQVSPADVIYESSLGFGPYRAPEKDPA